MQSVSIVEMMDAREYRQRLQSQLLKDNNGTLISFTLNIPGAVKTSPEYQWAFREGISRITDQIDSQHHRISSQLIRSPKTGYEFYGIVYEKKDRVKSWMCAIEENDSLGRLFDIDVLGPGMEKAERTGIGRPARKCLICGQDAKLCARSRAHSVERMVQEIDRIILNAKVEKALQKALLGEVYTTPKPGLVDRHDNGAHKDMTVETFEKSTAAIVPWLVDMFDIGHCWERTEQELFQAIRQVGKQAERAMFIATDGVNTHKGAVFSIGILAAAAGYCYSKTSDSFDAEHILETAEKMTKEILTDELQKIQQKAPSTNGEILYHQYGEKGIRGEVMAGFPVLKHMTLPSMRSMKQMMRGKCNQNEVYLQILLLCIVSMTDTNVLSRSGFDYHQLEWLQNQTASILRCGGAFSKEGIKAVQKLNTDCIEKNISPGGCADMLAATIFLTELEINLERQND